MTFSFPKSKQWSLTWQTREYFFSENRLNFWGPSSIGINDLQRLVQVDSGLPSPLLPGWLSCSCPCSCRVITYPLGLISLFLQSGLFYLLQSDWTIWVPYISLSVSRLKTVLGLVFLLTMLLPLPCLSPFSSLKVQHKGLFLWEVWSFQNLPKKYFLIYSMYLIRPEFQAQKLFYSLYSIESFIDDHNSVANLQKLEPSIFLVLIVPGTLHCGYLKSWSINIYWPTLNSIVISLH